jgi:acyl carrier protein
MRSSGMTEQEIREVVKRALRRIAPETDLESLPGDADLREAIDLDSMDLLNFFVSLHEQLKVDIAESDYGRLRTLGGCVAYLMEKLR